MTAEAANVLLALRVGDLDTPIQRCGAGMRELVERKLAMWGPPGGLPRLTRNGSAAADLELRSRLH